MKLIRKILPAATHAFLCLMCMMMANSMFFYHEHSLESGEIIRHAHPFFSEEDEQNRNHTENEILLLDMVTHAQYFLPDAFGFIAVEAEIISAVSEVLVFCDPEVAVFKGLTLRGPPKFTFS